MHLLRLPDRLLRLLVSTFFQTLGAAFMLLFPEGTGFGFGRGLLDAPDRYIELYETSGEYNLRLGWNAFLYNPSDWRERREARIPDRRIFSIGPKFKSTKPPRLIVF